MTDSSQCVVSPILMIKTQAGLDFMGFCSFFCLLHVRVNLLELYILLFLFVSLIRTQWPFCTAGQKQSLRQCRYTIFSPVSFGHFLRKERESISASLCFDWWHHVEKVCVYLECIYWSYSSIRSPAQGQRRAVLRRNWTRALAGQSVTSLGLALSPLFDAGRMHFFFCFLFVSR